MRRLLIAAVLTWLFALPATANAQDRLSFDLGLGLALPTEDVADADLDPGFGFEGTLAVRVLPHLWVYGGWDWMMFSADNSFAGATADFEETGYAYGLRFEHPIASASDLAFRVRVGGTYNHIEIENEEGDLVEDSGHEVGFEAGAGLVLPLWSGWSLTPGARFRTLSQQLTVEGTATDVDLRYVILEVGFSRSF